MNRKILFVAMAGVLLSCSKPKEEAETCEDTNTTKVTFTNSTSTALRVVVSGSLTPQYEPVNPILTIDLAAGQSVVKEFQAGRYANTWYSGCPSACTRLGNDFKDYNQCGEYEEKR